MNPLNEGQLNIGCYATAVVLNLVIAIYGWRVSRRLDGSGVFAKTASFTALAALAFAGYNAASILPRIPSVVLSSIQVVGVMLLGAAAYRLYTLVRTE